MLKKRAPAHHIFTFNSWYLYELKHKVHFSKTMFGVFHFWFRLVFIKVYIFVQQKAWTLNDYVTLNRHNPFQNQNNREATHSFAPRILTFKFQQEVLKFNNICMSWNIPKTELETNFLNLKKRSFEPHFLIVIY